MTSTTRHVPVAIVGGGQAGLSVSYHLKQRGIAHLVFEKHTAAHTWATQRWDTFCLVTPNWQCDLPGHRYDGPDPDGFMRKDEIVAYLEAFVAKVRPPIREGVAVTRVARRDDGLFAVQTSEGDYTADEIVVASGGYHTPIIPRLAERLPPAITQIHSNAYRNPAQLPDGAVLVVGSGQSGAQIAEDLHLAGRQVHLAVGDAPRCARFYRGRDVVAWLADMGYYEKTVDDHPLRDGVRDNTNHYVTGRDGGRDIDLRRFALEGMALHGILDDYADGALRFRDNLRRSLDQADRTYNGINAAIDAYIAEAGIAAPVQAPYSPVWEPGEPVTALPLEGSGITSIVWCIGFAPDFRWLDASVFNGAGRPKHRRGVTQEAGISFVGLPWLNTWGSGRFGAVGRDAEYIVQVIQARLGAGAVGLKRAV
ncbi:putative flavoprotein involved in K+ transport [Methylobacterium sp. PvP062]|uniref:Flavoprotein involved in K+ transport n=1 Tax=Methylobacterium radiotolerans TaxID=31998 RepID=A0ABV2NCR5_9HYPH|nr:MULTISPECIES: MSMEG_0569 family flavin-dependent oxidoreductase [Methylobacterium]MCX7333411.1 MSMEG_0569 family flavin-dependent oxidoreductase [Hyphomicrobiales bacterium]KIU37202.1 FAD-dependent oxidoreductase [Methylobacterium radiotolerans]KTS10577.1 FAD-dependent oxidoreductase [Methylobacterium radiotolerans]KTS49947.1 FAD-dependent oxidoreductase [Methylobacterium radiotolerans]MBP2492477.1 putative flavoprotein involved in K+ transport [Methylobacterium sp. PvP105]